jgi:outer membrane protein
MRRSSFDWIGLFSLAMGMAGSNPSAAQTASVPAKTWSLGAAAIWSVSPYRDYDNKALAVPAINYEGSHFFLRGIVLGYTGLGPPGPPTSNSASSIACPGPGS